MAQSYVDRNGRIFLTDQFGAPMPYFDGTNYIYPDSTTGGSGSEVVSPPGSSTTTSSANVSTPSVATAESNVSAPAPDFSSPTPGVSTFSGQPSEYTGAPSDVSYGPISYSGDESTGLAPSTIGGMVSTAANVLGAPLGVGDLAGAAAQSLAGRGPKGTAYSTIGSIGPKAGLAAFLGPTAMFGPIGLLAGLLSFGLGRAFGNLGDVRDMEDATAMSKTAGMFGAMANPDLNARMRSYYGIDLNDPLATRGMGDIADPFGNVDDDDIGDVDPYGGIGPAGPADNPFSDIADAIDAKYSAGQISPLDGDSGRHGLGSPSGGSGGGGRSDTGGFSGIGGFSDPGGYGV